MLMKRGRRRGRLIGANEGTVAQEEKSRESVQASRVLEGESN